MGRRKYHIRSEYRGKIVAFKDGLTLPKVNAMEGADKLIERRPDIAKYFEDSEGRAVNAIADEKPQNQTENAKPKKKPAAKKTGQATSKKSQAKTEDEGGFSASDLED